MSIRTLRRPTHAAPRLLAPLVAIALVALAGPRANAGLTDRAHAKERAIKSMPIECRPNRLGHVYGNNVRRLHHGRLCVNCGRYQKPVKRFFTVP